MQEHSTSTNLGMHDLVLHICYDIYSEVAPVFKCVLTVNRIIPLTKQISLLPATKQQHSSQCTFYVRQCK